MSGNKILNAAFIGCGGFARAMHAPLLMANPRYRIRAAMDIDEEAAYKLYKQTGASYYTSSLDNLLGDPLIDVVFITTRHDTHAELCIRAAAAGKHILCEKPMALNAADCKRVAEAVAESRVKYAIGYNRGLAPMVTESRRLLDAAEGKIMIYHRIQAYFPESHWTHDEAVGGGRFVGEGCHIFDLFCELVKSEPVSVYASGGTFLDPEKVHIPDSAAVTVTFRDGSVAVTLINSAGCDKLSKESTEIYCDRKAIVITDFTRMECYGFEGRDKTVIEYSGADKGHAVEIDRLADCILDGAECPNGIEKAARAAVISYKAVESLRCGKPVTISRSEYAFDKI